MIIIILYLTMRLWERLKAWRWCFLHFLVSESLICEWVSEIVHVFTWLTFQVGPTAFLTDILKLCLCFTKDPCLFSTSMSSPAHIVGHIILDKLFSVFLLTAISLKSCEKDLAGKKLSLFSSQILVRAKTKVCARESEISRNKWGGLGRLRGQTHATTETI